MSEPYNGGSSWPSAPELWGGLECTVNRVADEYRDQTKLSGHEHRPRDLDLFATLGFKALRYPVLWERTAPERGGAPDWRWTDQRLNRLRVLGVRPIAGLVHHGSGPRHTHLLDPGFAAGLGTFAGLAAARYPWIEDWTPVNEPLTTARFSALYGHWYPHCRDARSFWLALLNQVDATRAAMRAIRRVNSAARLIATDDLGRTYSTPQTAEQAEHDNARRWAGWDLLFGRVTVHDPVGDELRRLGLGDRMQRIADDPCPPDVVGVNHYLTSDRFLDHRVERYPDHLHGGSECLRYADTEAVRVLDPPIDGLRVALRETWERYRTPIAITEVHLGCTREEQLRWAAAAWDAAVEATREGVDVRAVTAWSLLGSHGWDTLLTGVGSYEPGVFDVGTGEPRPTALASLWRGLPLGERRHPAAVQPGWWQRPDRLLYPLAPCDETAGKPSDTEPAPVLIVGAQTRNGRAFADACRARGLHHVALARDRVAAVDMIARTKAWAVIDASGENDDATGSAPADALTAACSRLRIPCLLVRAPIGPAEQPADRHAASPARDVDTDVKKVGKLASKTLRLLVRASADDRPAHDSPAISRRTIDRLLDQLIDGEGVRDISLPPDVIADHIVLESSDHDAQTKRRMIKRG